jgi:hypothetical protein
MINTTVGYCRSGILAIVMGLAWLVSPPQALAGPEPVSGAADAAMWTQAAAWSAQSDNGWDIFFAIEAAGRWGPAIQVTRSGGLNLVPALTAAADKSIWIFWSVQEGKEIFLYSTRIQDGEVATPEPLPVMLATNLAPCALTDLNGEIWLVWSGHDGNDDDIYFSRWDGSGWSPPIRVHPDNHTPDIQPVLGMDADGTVWVYWKGFSDGAYRPFAGVWNGVDWESRQLSEEDNPYRQLLTEQVAALPDEWPVEMGDPDKGSLLKPDASVQSLPIFFRRFLATEPAQTAP